MWFLQARCGLLFTIINHNHNHVTPLLMNLESMATWAMADGGSKGCVALKIVKDLEEHHLHPDPLMVERR